MVQRVFTGLALVAAIVSLLLAINLATRPAPAAPAPVFPTPEPTATPSSSVAVYCFVSLDDRTVNRDTRFACTTAEGVTFEGTVPEGKYIFVTDVQVNSIGAPTSSRIEFKLLVDPLEPVDESPNNGRIASYTVPSDETYEASYQIPVVIAGPGDSLMAFRERGAPAEVRLSGVMADSLAALPLPASP